MVKQGNEYGIWVWVNTYRYIFSGMSIHKSQLNFGVHGTVPGFWPIPIFNGKNPYLMVKTMEKQWYFP